MNLIIRREETKDYKIVEAITREAFYNSNDLKEKGFPCSEAFFVHKLREKDGIIELSLVAEYNNIIVGHIIYSHSYILTNTNTKIEAVTFGPISVKKDYQNKGVGKALINFSMKKAKDLGYKAIIIYGHPDYYKKFDFIPASSYGITTKDGLQFPAFMAKELENGYLSETEGKFFESNVFDEEYYKSDIIEFERNNK